MFCTCGPLIREWQTSIIVSAFDRCVVHTVYVKSMNFAMHLNKVNVVHFHFLSAPTLQAITIQWTEHSQPVPIIYVDNINSLKMSIAEYSVELIVTNWNEGPNLHSAQLKHSSQVCWWWRITFMICENITIINNYC